MDNGLRELVQRYFQGEMSYGQYRNARGRLIDAVAGTDSSDTASGITAPHVREPTIVAPQPAQVRTAPQSQTQPYTQTQTQMRLRRAPPVVASSMPAEQAKTDAGRRGWLIGAAVLALLGVLGAVLVFGNRAPAPVQTPAVAEAPQGTSGQKILAAFLRANDWSAGGIAGFSHDWDALDPAARQTARQTPEFQRLADALYQRIAEQRALEDAAGAPPPQGKQVITAFAEYLGIDYASLQAKAPAASVQPSSAAATSPIPTAQTATDKPAEQAAKVNSTPATAPPVAPPPVEAAKAPDQPAAAVVAAAPSKPATTTPDAADAHKTAAATKIETGTAGTAGACRVALLGTRRPLCNDRVAEGVDGPLLVVIPGGEFQMGSTQNAEEQPPHPVRIARPFAMSTHEISVAEFLRYCRASQTACPPDRWPGDDYPVVDVSWRDAEGYVRWLSQVTGQHYRLPSEAEWEYAARAGSTTAYPSGDELLITDARFSAQKQETTPLPNNDHTINRNRFRLANMAGNVREWVQDAWQNSYLGAPADGTARAGGAGERVVRGGSYADAAVQLRSSARAHLPAESRDAVTGFRIVREMGE